MLDALAKAQGLDYERQRKAVAKELEVSARAIDNEVRARREDNKIAPLYGHWITEPWPEPIALWVMMSWVHDEIATHSPILNINSAEPSCVASARIGCRKCTAGIERDGDATPGR